MTAEPFQIPATVTEILGLVSDVLVASTDYMKVTGTISGFQQRKHWSYGELVAHNETDRIESRIRLVFLPRSLPNGRLDLDGTEVIVFGKLTIHRLYGPLQFCVYRLTVVGQESSAARATTVLRRRIEADSLDKINKRLRLPYSADTLTLICPTGGGAGGADFLDRLRVGGHRWSIDTIEVPMSGTGAIAAISEAVARAQQPGCQAIVICRGGGAATDLVAFDSSEVAQVIVAATTPVIVAVGHATDNHIVDLVAHTSLPTPSAAAAWLNERRSTALQQAEALVTKAAQARAAAAEATAARETLAATAAQQQSKRRERHALIAAAAAMLVIVVVLFLVASAAM